jgi:hypothetical protein
VWGFRSGLLNQFESFSEPRHMLVVNSPNPSACVSASSAQVSIIILRVSECTCVWLSFASKAKTISFFVLLRTSKHIPLFFSSNGQKKRKFLRGGGKKER